jgi:type II secretory pathway component PulM
MVQPGRGLDSAVAERREARDRERRKARQRRVLVWMGGTLALAVVFLVGYVVGGSTLGLCLP